MNKKITYGGFYALCILLGAVNFYYILLQHKLSPVDELAHYDYIVKRSKLNFSHDPESEIEPELQAFYQSENTSLVLKKETDLWQYSYELHQPDLYYIIMAAPEYILRKAGSGIYFRIQAIRIISWLFILIGLCAGYLSLKKIRKEVLRSDDYMIEMLYVIFWLLFININRYGISNDRFTLFITNVTVFMLVKYYRHPQIRNLAVVFAGIVFMLLTKIILAPAAVALTVVVCYLLIKKYPSIPVGSAATYFAGTLAMIATAACCYSLIETTGTAHTIFIQLIPENMESNPAFMKRLYMDFFPQITNQVLSKITAYCLLTLTISGAILFIIRSLINARTELIFSAVYMFCILLAGFMVYLNMSVPGVFWAGIRHYLGYSLVWYWVISGGWYYLKNFRQVTA